jgi:hypothetical protein
MSDQIDNAIKQAAEQIPKVGVWLWLQNLKIAIELVFYTLRELLSLALFLAGLYVIYVITPPLSSIKTIIGG